MVGITGFHEWPSHEWKSLANHLTSDQKIVIHSNECIILFLSRYFMFWTHNSAINNHRSFILPSSSIFCLSIMTSPQLICDVTWTSTVMSYSSIVLARANWLEGDLHKWITTVNIDFSPPGIHGLACKNTLSYILGCVSCYAMLYAVMLWDGHFSPAKYPRKSTPYTSTSGKIYRADSRLVPSQWELSLQSNAVSHWLGANLESALI